MHRLFKFIGFLIVLGIVFLLAVIFVPVQRTGPVEALSPDYKAPEGRGKYMAELADCAACHTRPGGAPFSGGAEVASPFGTIYASNITPDKETGIGGWTLAQFRDALRDGIANNGSHLYPAMPYENYRTLSEEDIAALYNYFMHKVPAVSNRITTTNLTFPFNQRWGIRLWNWFAIAGNGGFKPRYNDAKLDRGAYIVESLAHCGACHTPRDLMFRQAAKTAQSDQFLRGQVIDGWYAPDLRDPSSSLSRWSREELKNYLKTGRNSYTAVVGPMSLVVGDSLQFASDEDIDAIAAYLQYIRLPGKAPEPVTDPALTTTMLTDAAPDMPLGARLYLDNCNACHFVNGKGAPGIFPELAQAKIVNADDPSGLLQIIIGGARMPSTFMRPAPIAMPAFGWRLNDGEVAALATFLRTAWGNNAKAVSAKDAEKARARVAIEK